MITEPPKGYEWHPDYPEWIRAGHTDLQPGDYFIASWCSGVSQCKERNHLGGIYVGRTDIRGTYYYSYPEWAWIRPLRKL